jgi:GNAT superfamily N-acetyltransferase
MASIRALEPDDDVRGFESGNEDLDRFLRRYAAKNQYQLHVGVTYVAVEGRRLLGFVTIAPASLQADSIPASREHKFPAYPLPVLRLARLATQRPRQRQGIGSALVRFVFLKAVELSRAYGCVGVVVDPKPESLLFYVKLGFVPMATVEGALRAPGVAPPVFLSIGDIQSALGGS